MKKITFLFVLILGLGQLTSEEASTESGRKVILNSDFTWKYADPNFSRNKNENQNSVVLTKSVDQEKELKSVTGQFSIWYNPQKWNIARQKINKATEFELENVRQLGYAMVIFEKSEIPINSFPDLLIFNARNVDPKAYLIETINCNINRKQGKLIKYAVILNRTKFIFYSFVTSNKNGSIQFITYSSEKNFDAEKEEFEKLLSGITFSFITI